MRITTIGLAFALALGMSAPVVAQSAPKEKAKAAQTTPKAGKDEKVCRHTHPSGQKRVWVCKKVEPCCAWDLINYVKCGSTITGCL